MTSTTPDEKPVYSRKLTRDEVKSGAVLILKSAWKRFPEPGTPLTLEVGDDAVESTVEVEMCECVPPLHKHYHLPLPQLSGEGRLPPGTRLDFYDRGGGCYRIVVL